MILAILIVIGLPTFLGVKSRFRDRAAQTDLRNAVLSARILFTDTASFPAANIEQASGLFAISPDMCYVAAATTSAATGTVACASGVGPGSISIGSTTTQFSAARLSNSQSCFAIMDAASGTKYAKTTAANCDAAWAATAGNVTAMTSVAGGW